MNKKQSPPKPQLYIQIRDFNNRVQEFKQTTIKNEVLTKPLRSAKNMHEMKKFTFDDQKLQQCNTGRQLRKLKKLQKQKANLMHSLQILKVSAVSAIAQKEEQIEIIKSRDALNQEENIEALEKDLEQGLRIREELQDQREQLYRQLYHERERYITELGEKEELVEELCQEIQGVRRQLEMLEDNNYTQSRKIKLLMQQNSKLSDQLEESSLATAVKQRTEQMMMIDMGQTIKAKSAISAACSQPFNRSYISYIESDHHFQSEADKSFMFQKLEDMQRLHKDQLLDLKGFYEKRIESLRDIYERELNLQTEQSQKTMGRSRNNSRSSTPCLQKSQSRKLIDTALTLNLKQMYSIQESVENELQTSRSKMMNLKNEIKMQNLSECPSLEPRTLGNQDAESQFTTKYFDVPTRFMLKRNRSTDTFEGTNDPDNKTTCRLARKQESRYVRQETQAQNTFIKGPVIFGAGLVSGVVLMSLMGLLFKKN